MQELVPELDRALAWIERSAPDLPVLNQALVSRVL
jgi:hypothetical protein